MNTRYILLDMVSLSKINRRHLSESFLKMSPSREHVRHDANKNGTLPESTRSTTPRPSFSYYIKDNWEGGICIVCSKSFFRINFYCNYANTSAELRKLFLPMIQIQSLRSSSYTRLMQSNMAEYQQSRSPWRYLYIPISANIQIL